MNRNEDNHNEMLGYEPGTHCPVLDPAAIRSRIEAGRLQFTALGLEKKCGGCEEFWPFDNQFFHINRDSSPDGLSNWCKACFAERTQRSKSLRDPDNSKAA